jgi:hypothetical protein
MATVFVYVHGDRAVTRVIDWCKGQGLECYVAPRSTDARAVADHVGIENISAHQQLTLTKWLEANGHKVRIGSGTNP